MPPVLKFTDISRSFVKDIPVLEGVTFNVEREQVVALLGRNGAGKTTLINIAMGLLQPDSGSVSLFGLSPFEHPVVVKRRIGFVGEQMIFPPGATVAELMALYRRLYPRWDAQYAKALLDRFGVPHVGMQIRALSKGMAQQVALLCAVCHRPELLILDEPASGLDPVIRRDFLETAVQLLNREGTSILFSTHQMLDVERLASHVVMLDKGSIKLESDLVALRESYSVAFIDKHDLHSPEKLRSIAGCLQVRDLGARWHAVFRGAPAVVRTQIQLTLGLSDVQCTAVPLEELFIELVGDRRVERNAA